MLKTWEEANKGIIEDEWSDDKSVSMNTQETILQCSNPDTTGISKSKSKKSPARGKVTFQGFQKYMSVGPGKRKRGEDAS